MKIVRLYIVEYGQTLSDPNRNLMLKGEKVGVSILSEISSDKNTIQILAGILEYDQSLISDGHIQINEEKIREIDEILEYLTNLISLSEGTTKQISVPSPSFYFIPKSLDEALFLKKTTVKFQRKFRYVYHDSYFDILRLFPNLMDRIDGISILTEATNSNHAIGAFRDYIRLYERAFKRNKNSGIISKIIQFSNQTEFKYSKNELNTWFNLRDPASHGDKKEITILESDIKKYLHRMRQMAYDILLNKKDWNSEKTEREERWKPKLGTFTDEDDIFIYKGLSSQAKATLLDEFGRYPMNLKITVNSKSVPDNWIEPSILIETPESKMKILENK